MGLMGYLNTLLSALTGDVTITSAASLDILQMNASGKWVNRPPVGTETNSTPVAGGNDTVIGTANRYYTFITLPTTAPYYLITGIETLNGTVAAGSWMAHVERVAEIPATTTNVGLYCFSVPVAMSGTSAVQRTSQMVGCTTIPGGSTLGLSLVTNNATARFGTTTVASGNYNKAIALAVSPVWATSSAWVAGTEEVRLKLYYKPVLGV